MNNLPKHHGVGPEAQSEWDRRDHAPPRKSLLKFFDGVLCQSQLFENKSKEQSDSCSVVFSHWPRFNVTFCNWMWNYIIRLKHATLFAKLPINVGNTIWGSAGFRGRPKGPGPRAPTKRVPPPRLYVSPYVRHIRATSVIFISEEISLFRNAIKLPVVQTIVFQFNIVW